MSGVVWVAEQILAATARHSERPAGLPRYNPKPPGQLQPGGATEVVINFLAKHPGTFFRHSQIHAHCKQYSRAAVDWALIRLRSWGAIETTPDDSRNPRYLRYRLVKMVKVAQ